MCSEHDAEPEGMCSTVFSDAIRPGVFASSEGKMATFGTYFVSRRYTKQGYLCPVTRFDTNVLPEQATWR